MKKKLLPVLGIIVMLACVLAVPALAKDIVLEAKVESVTLGITSAGDAYARIIVTEERTLQGTKYTAGVPVMAFRDLANDARKYGEGDKLKAIVSPREYQGKASYLVRKFLD